MKNNDLGTAHPAHHRHHMLLKTKPAGVTNDTPAVVDDLNFAEEAMQKTRGRSMNAQERDAVEHLPKIDRVEFDRIKKAKAFDQIP